MSAKPVPCTVFTGFLGSGKTTIILNLLQKTLAEKLKIVVLKNEFGDASVDSLLTQTSAIEVKEMVNGCLCCVLVGQMKNALLELVKLNPDRIIIETSGSAFPAPISWQIRELKELHLDSIITVIDAENFRGYQDTSKTAEIQAQYTDLILINKHELVSERELDLVIDHINTLNTDTPKILYRDSLDLELFFGIDTRLFEVAGDYHHNQDHHQSEVDLIQIVGGECPIEQLEQLLATLPKDEVYRVKGAFPTEQETLILNWAFGRYQWHKSKQLIDKLKITVMGNGLFRFKSKFAAICTGEISFLAANTEQH
jgi:G3E family GTPase